jgi:hypothetical protein
VRVRLGLGVALLAVAGALVLEMSGRAPRQAGSDHISPAVFAATVPAGGLVCQPAPFLPDDAARAQILIGTYGRPAPALRLSFLDAAGARVASGQLAAGAHEGTLVIPLSRVHGAPAAASVCLRVSGAAKVALGGEGGPVNPTSELVDNAAQPGRISLIYLRGGRESWWQLLPVLSERFGLGKAYFFGDWTLAFCALLLLGVWVGTIRLLLRELT